MSIVKFSLCLLLASLSQERFELVRKIKGGYNKISVDGIGNIYAITKEQNLHKISNLGDTLYTFEDKSFFVSHVDPSNPLKILVYDNSQNTVEFLDKTLTPINSRIQLDELGIPFSNAVSSSRDNLFWVFDDSSQELKKYNRQLQEVANSGSLSALTGINIQPIHMLESDAKIYLLDSVQGVFQFDHLGTYLFNFKKIQGTKIVVKGDKIVFLKKNELYLYDTVLLSVNRIQPGEDESLVDFAISGKELFTISEHGVSVYQEK